MRKGEESDDLVWGASNIARVINRTDRQTFHLLDQGIIPARKVGNRWVAGRGQLMNFFLGEGQDIQGAA